MKLTCFQGCMLIAIPTAVLAELIWAFPGAEKPLIVAVCIWVPTALFVALRRHKNGPLV